MKLTTGSKEGKSKKLTELNKKLIIIRNKYISYICYLLAPKTAKSAICRNIVKSAVCAITT